MNYYSHHIGDFRSGTFNMSRLERWLYRDMLDIYYDTERPLPLDVEKLLNDLGTKDEHESTAVQRLLRFKFEKTAEGYRHERCEEEISSYREKADAASRAGKASAVKRTLNKRSTGVEQTLNEIPTDDERSSTNQEPITNNHKPITINQEPILKSDAAKPLDAEFEKAWAEYPKRPGANKAGALKSWTARRKAGVSSDAMLNGVRRYAQYCVATGKVGTEYVKQAATFFGPDKHFESDWTIPQQPRASPRPEKFDPVAHVNRNRIIPP